MIIWLIALGVVVTLAVLLPPEIGVKADPLAPPPPNIKPEWYFLAVLETLKLFPGSIMGLNGETIAILCVSAGILFLFLIPFFDRKANRGEKSPVFTYIAVAYVVYFIVMTAVGFLS
jgi:cytochrome b6